MPLNYLKKALLLETSEFSVSREIDDETSFKWRVPCTLHRRDRIVAGVSKRIRKVTHKHGVEFPTPDSQAKKLEENNGKLYVQTQ